MKRPLLASLLSSHCPGVRRGQGRAERTTSRPRASPPCSTARTSTAGKATSHGRAQGRQRRRAREAQGRRNKLMAETWTVKDGIIHHVPKIVDVRASSRRRGCSLQTAKDYGDFEWHVDWKIEKAGDSGLYLRGQPQVQIWDSDNLTEGLKADKGTGSGGLWNNPLPKGADPKSIGKMPLKKADKPVGEWNTFKIVMKGDKVTIHLNGELVVDNAAAGELLRARQAAAGDGPDRTAVPRRQAVVQEHLHQGTEVRNSRIRRIVAKSQEDRYSVLRLYRLATLRQISLPPRS